MNSQTDILTETTESLPIEEQLREMKDLEKRKDDFIRVASHELRTPVTTMKVYLHILEEYFKKNEDKQHEQFAAKAGEQVNKLSKLINDLLDLSKIQKDGLQLELSVLPYQELIEEVIENFQLLTRSHTIELTGTCTAKIKGDKERLSQAIINLLSNAIKYSPNQNKVVVQLSEDDKFITTTIKDFGIGISKDSQDKIFDRFYRVNDKQKQTYPGLGIGLYITSEIIKRHAGNIWVQSEHGKETNFTFTLPIYSEK